MGERPDGEVSARPLADEGRRTLAPFGRREAVVEAVERIGPYRLLVVRDPLGPADPRAGQFYMLSAVEGWGAGPDDRPHLPRAFSFARARDGRLSFLLEPVGPGTERLACLAPGQAVWLTGPLGVGFRLPRAGAAVLVGGGIGVAPILAAHEQLDPGHAVLLGFRSGHHAEARRLFSGPSVATDDGAVGPRALVTDLLEEELEVRGNEAEVLACGPPPMLEAVRALCARRGTAAQLALESGMACGYGACFGCVVPTRSGYVRLCLDGPVLDAAVLDGVAG